MFGHEAPNSDSAYPDTATDCQRARTRASARFNAEFENQFKPTFREAALLDDAEMLAAVTALNRQITELAPVLNGPTIRDAGTVESDNPEVPVALMAKQHKGATYLFAVGMRDGATMAKFRLGETRGERVEVLGENRMIAVRNGSFSDRLDPWDVHLYRLPAETADGHR